MKVHHIEITVQPDRQTEAEKFYIDFMGFTKIEKPESLEARGGFWARLDNIDLHVGIESGVDRTLTKVHVAYEVADLKVWREKIVGRGLTVKESIPIPGFVRFEFRDPFGNRVELISPQ